VVTRSRDRETDEKRVAAVIYDAGNAWQRDSDAKRTARQGLLLRQRKTTVFCREVSELFFYIYRCGVCVHDPFFSFFLLN
jgi:hypothetical protein